ncbi:MAG: NAD(P)/FAD-dependent oxidoreductase [Anaerolineae bacterium]|nr:NAD(P)/FAD-dependent oxidoreductase [Anaerolineae bacterium]
MAAIWAGRANPQRNILLLDGSHKPGMKILVSGGGRCNVTHEDIDEQAYAGSSRHAIKKVLRRFDVPQTLAFFNELGVDLGQEDGGKLFPSIGHARTILDALHQAARDVGVGLHYPCRVEAVERHENGFHISGKWGCMEADHLILATGGRSLPQSGSDGHGHQIVLSLGHTVTRTFPALVPLTLPREHFICTLSGLSLPVTLDLRSGDGKRLQAFTGSMLCAHFGISGPVVLDMSRHYIAAKHADTRAELVVNWLPEETAGSLERELLALGRKSVVGHLRDRLPGRLADALCIEAGISGVIPGDQLTRKDRKALVKVVTSQPLPITGDRGFAHAEVTAGGVPLSELYLETMESRICSRLHLCGEICDVDGRIGGYNFQWAWASGYIAGGSVGR